MPRSSSKSPIHSVKHYKQDTLSSVSAGAIANIIIATAVVPADADAVNEVTEGSVIKAVYCEYWLQNGTTSLGSFTATLAKVPDSQTPATGDLASIGQWTNKKNVLFTTQGISPANDSNAPLNLIRTWVAIPKGKQRFGAGDRLIFSIRNNNGADDINYCGFSTYKEYQ